MNNKTKQSFNFWPYFAKHKGSITLWIILLVVDIAIQTFYGIYGAIILADISAKLYTLAIKKFLIMLSVIVFSNIISHVRNIIYIKTNNKVVKAMSVDIAMQAFSISDKSYTDHSTSSFTQRIQRDPSTIFNSLSGFVSNIQQLITAIIMISYIIIINWLVGIIAVTTIGVIFILEHFRRKILKKNKKELLKRGEKTGSLLNEIVRSQKDIKSLNLENTLKENITDLANSQAEQDIKTYTTNRRFQTFRNIALNSLITGLLVLGLWQTNLGILSVASFMIIYTNRYEITTLSNVTSNLGDYLTEISLAQFRINELYEDDEYKIEKFGNKTLKKVKGHIEFNNVSFAYTEYKIKSDEDIKKELIYNKKHKIKTKIKTREEIGKNQIFENLNFEIEPNTTVSFVGISGSGKTTILNLISKMYDVDKGQVLIDGVDIQKLSKNTIRSSISYVNQSPYIFDMSIKENLLLAKLNATEQEINQALLDASLLEFVNSLPNKIETIVGESGIKLSGGQKQRLAIARAMLRKSPIIIFDESTSSLDNLAQKQVKESIDNIKGKSTVVIVAHRLSTIKNVDKIFFLEKGEIVDSGTFNELYKRNKNFKTIFLAEEIN